MPSLAFVSLAFLLPLAFGSAVRRATAPTATIISNTSFNSQANFDASWNYLYPWGTDHNGAARMNAAHVSISGGVLTMTSQPVTGQPDGTFNNQPLPIHYLSGTVFAKDQFTVKAGGGFDFSAEFIAPVQRGTWPAFWLTAVSGWPPEIDLAEWKGDGKISFNTFNTSSVVAALDVTYNNPTAWHSVLVQVRAESNGHDVTATFFLDGQRITEQFAPNYVGKALWLIIDYQMEGSSGSPGPTTNTTYSIRNLEVLSYNP